jgi:hypothetical protein
MTALPSNTAFWFWNVRDLLEDVPVLHDLPIPIKRKMSTSVYS